MSEQGVNAKVQEIKNPKSLSETSGFWIKLNMKHSCATPSQQQAFMHKVDL